MDAEDETTLTEITILPDGRVYVFGMSQPILEILGGFQPADRRVRELLQHTHANNPDEITRERID